MDKTGRTILPPGPILRSRVPLQQPQALEKDWFLSYDGGDSGNGSSGVSTELTVRDHFFKVQSS